MHYTIHQLQLFIKVLETKSITKAAEEMYMTQPAVSVQLKKFQDQFEVPLVEVIGRQLYVTDFGKEIGILAEQVLQNLDQINFKTQAYKGLLTGKLTISSVSTGKYLIPYFLTGFLDKHAGIDLVLDVTNKQKVVEELQENSIDFALVSVLPEKLELEEEFLMENKLFLVGSSPEKKEDKPLIYREKGSATRSAMEKYFNSHNAKQRKSMELTSNEAVKQAVIADIGISLLPLIGIKNELMNRQLFIIEEEDLPITTKWRMVWLKGKKLNPIAEAFLGFVKANKFEITNNYFKWYLEYK